MTHRSGERLYNIYDYLKSYVREFNRNSRRINVEIISYGPSDDQLVFKGYDRR